MKITAIWTRISNMMLMMMHERRTFSVQLLCVTNCYFKNKFSFKAIFEWVSGFCGRYLLTYDNMTPTICSWWMKLVILLIEFCLKVKSNFQLPVDWVGCYVISSCDRVCSKLETYGFGAKFGPIRTSIVLEKGSAVEGRQCVHRLA